MIHLGRQGFVCIEDALRDAEETCTDAVAILKYRGEYAWVFPVEYAEELVASNPSIRLAA